MICFLNLPFCNSFILIYTGVRPVGQDLKKIVLLDASIDGICSKMNYPEPKFRNVLLDGLFSHKRSFYSLKPKKSYFSIFDRSGA